MIIAEGLLFLSAISFSWPFIWYPLIVHLFPTKNFLPEPPQTTEGVSVLVPCFNEAAVIEQKILELRKQLVDRPFEIVIVDDGSTDTTSEIAERLKQEYPEIQVIRFPRLGKGEAINRAWNHLTHPIVVVTDANAELAPNAIQHLLRPFSDQRVGETRGRFFPKQISPTDFHQASAQYQDFNHRLFTQESNRNMLHVSGGALQAFRRSLHSPSLALTMTEDWDMTLEIRSQGKAVIYTPDAIAYKRITTRNDELWRQNVRLVYGSLQTAWKYKYLANPWRYGRISFAFLSGKTAQIFGPVWILVGIISLSFIATQHHSATIALLLLLTYTVCGGIFFLQNIRGNGSRAQIIRLLEFPIATEMAATWAWLLFLSRAGKNWKGWQPAASVRSSPHV